MKKSKRGPERIGMDRYLSSLCPNCDGGGFLFGDPCPECGGVKQTLPDFFKRVADRHDRSNEITRRKP